VGDEMPGGAAGFLAGFSAGSRIAGYRLEEQIGRGGMAVVFRARDERLQRQVALKILAPALAVDEAFRQRFIRESRSAASVDDPHIIPVFEAGDVDGVLFIAMRYVPGGDARTLVQREGPLSPARGAAIISAVASALDAAHAAGLVHRDVKPANMLVDARPGRPDHVYLSDFGLSKGALSSVGITGTGQFLGTLDYSAPEQIEGRPVDGRTDEYALACAAFELLSGVPPFPRDQGMAVLYAQLSAPPPLLTSRCPGFPPAVDDVLARALAKAPVDRYASCRDFAEALRMAFGLQPYDSARDVSPPPDHPPTEVAHLGGRGEQLRAATAAAGPRQPPAGGPDTIGGKADSGLRPVPAAGGGSSGGDAGDQAQPVRGGRHGRSGLISLAAVAILAVGGVIAAAIVASAPGQGSGPSSSPGTGRSTRPSAGHSPSSATPAAPGLSTAGPPRMVRSFADPGTGNQKVNSVAFSPDGKTLVTGDADGNAHVWAAGTGRQIVALPGRGKVFAVAFSPDGTMVATGYGNGSTSLWKAATGSLLDTFRDPGGGAVNSVAFSPHGDMLATGDTDGSTYLWDISRAGQTATPASMLADPAGAGIWALAFSPDGTTLATGDFHGSTYLWNVGAAAGSPAGPLTVPGGQDITAVAFSANGKTLATGSFDGSTYLWNVSSGNHIVIPEPDTVWGVAFSRSGTLAISDKDGTTYLWDVATSRQTAALPDPGSGSQGVGAVAFSADGKTLAAGDSNGSTYLWKVGRAGT
jgi:Protein kinase domain/WD domain, G-beta repeat